MFQWAGALAAYRRALRCDRQQFWRSLNSSAVQAHPMYQRRAVLVRYHRALAWIQLGRFQHAVLDLTGAIRRQRRHAPLFAWRALVFTALPEYDHAAADCRRAARLDERFASLASARTDEPKEMFKILAASPASNPYARALFDAIRAHPYTDPPDPTRRFQSLEGHTAPVTCVAFAADGVTVFSGSEDGTVRVWAAPDGELRHCLAGPGAAIRALAVSPDGSLLAAGGDGGLVCLWDVATGREVGRLEGHETAVVGVAFLDEGRRLLSAGDDGALYRWDVPAGRRHGEPLRDDSGPLTALALASDGRLALVAGEVEGEGGFVLACDLAGWEWAGSLSGGSPHRDVVRAVAFGPAPLRCFSAGGGGRDVWGDMIDCEVRRWDLAHALQVRSFPRRHRDAVWALAVAPTGRRLVSAGRDGGLYFWDVSTGRPVRRDVDGGRSEGDK